MEMYLDGHPQLTIARALRVSQPAVSKMLARVEERLLIDLAWRAERIRANHTLKLEYLYAEGQRGWKASHEDEVRRRQRRAGERGAMVSEIASDSQHGDPKYLELMRRTLGDIREIWGANTPKHLAIDHTAPFAALSDEELHRRLTTKLRALKGHGGALPDDDATGGRS